MRFKKLRGLWVPESYEEYSKPVWLTDNTSANELYNHYAIKFGWIGVDTSIETQAQSAVDNLLGELGLSVEGDVR